jgi:hypothetical protein
MRTLMFLGVITLAAVSVTTTNRPISIAEFIGSIGVSKAEAQSRSMNPYQGRVNGRWYRNVQKARARGKIKPGPGY